MTYDIYRYIFIGASILCGILFVVSVFVFIFLRIPKVISDLSGATARKAIKNIREQNEATGNKTHKVSALNQARGKLTDKISPSGNVIHRHQDQMGLGIETIKIETQELPVDESGNQTTVLESYNETSVLENQGAGETSVLSKAGLAGETTVLGEGINDATFTIEYEITFVHTNEMIATEAIG